MPPHLLVALQIQKLADRSDMIFDVPNALKSKFSGALPGPAPTV